MMAAQDTFVFAPKAREPYAGNNILDSRGMLLPLRSLRGLGRPVPVLCLQDLGEGTTKETKGSE